MSCSICGRSSCTASFHSLEEQALHEGLSELSDSALRAEVVQLRAQIQDLERQLGEALDNALDPFDPPIFP